MTTPSSLLRAAGLVGVCLSQSLAAATIFQENFDGDATTFINGTAPDVRPGSETWTAATDSPGLRTDGSNTLSGGRSAWLPFSVQSGYIYTMTAVVDNVLYASGSQTAVGISFTTNTPLSTAQPNALSSGEYGLLQVRRGGSWGFYEGDTNNGTPTASGANNSLFSETQDNYGITLVLDTSATNWTMAGYLGGNQVDLNGASAGLLYTYSVNPPTITGVGINYASAAFIFDSFTLDAVAAVPEPSSFAFIAGLGALGLTVVARRAKRS